MTTPAVLMYLQEQQRAAQGELSEEWARIEDLYQKRLWHQLTLRLKDFVKRPELQQGTMLIDLYRNLIADFEHRINPLVLCELVIPSIGQFSSRTEAEAFLTKLREKVRASDEAVLLCTCEMCKLRLAEEDLTAAKQLIAYAQRYADQIDGVSAQHANLYRVKSELARRLADHAEFYACTLRYLAAEKLDAIPEEEKRTLAFRLGVAALLGEGVYNLGALLAHPILTSLTHSSEGWLLELLSAVNAGSHDRVEALSARWKSQPDLLASEAIIADKLRLLALMHAALCLRTATGPQVSGEADAIETSEPHSQALTFADIARATRCEPEAVERLVMRALSAGLIRGAIDQVTGCVRVRWVQPRVLDTPQLDAVRRRFDAWATAASRAQTLVDTNAADMLRN